MDCTCQLPIDIVNYPVPGGKSLAHSERKFIDEVSTSASVESGSWQDRGCPWVVRILRNTAFYAEVPIAALIQRLAPGVGNHVGKARTISADVACSAL